MSTIVDSNGAFIKALQALVGGLQSGMPSGLNQLAAGGKVSLLTDLETEFSGYLTTFQSVETARVAYITALLTRHEIAAGAITRYEEVRAAVKAALGKKSPKLPALGMKPDKTPAPLTSEQKVERAAKAAATRKARGTLGPKQKKAIKGQLPPTPPEAPPAIPPITPLVPPPSPKPAGA